jgi:hypothetical protein
MDIGIEKMVRSKNKLLNINKMKKTIILFTAVAALLSACGEKKKTEASTTSTSTENTSTASNESSDDKTGEFTFDGKTVTGNASIQYFGSDKEKSNFSILCQHNEGATSANFELLQATFVNEKDATTNPNLKIYSGSSLPMTEPEPGIVAVALSGVGSDLGDKQFTGTSKSTGSITISNKVLIIKDLTLYDSDGKMKTVSAVIPF